MHALLYVCGGQAIVQVSVMCVSLVVSLVEEEINVYMRVILVMWVFCSLLKSSPCFRPF